MHSAPGFDSMQNIWMGSDFDGAFAQFVKIDAGEVFPVESDWSDAELGTIPCAYGTAENMLHRAKVSEGEHVLVAGASGGVGSAAVQLAKRRKAFVTAIAGREKRWPKCGPSEQTVWSLVGKTLSPLWARTRLMW